MVVAMHAQPSEGLLCDRHGHDGPMGIGTSLFLIAVGAILYFAVNADISGLEISTIGLILMVVGVDRPRDLAVLPVLDAPRRRRERTVVRDREPY